MGPVDETFEMAVVVLVLVVVEVLMVPLLERVILRQMMG